jgi:hypothetical protein
MKQKTKKMKKMKNFSNSDDQQIFLLVCNEKL